MNTWSYVMLGGLLILSGLVDAISGGGGLISISVYLMAGLSLHVANNGSSIRLSCLSTPEFNEAEIGKQSGMNTSTMYIG